MSAIIDNNIDESGSGFTESLDGEMRNAEKLNVQSEFGNIKQQYVSASGHARLFSATRYGKQYMLKGLKTDFLYTPVYRQALTKEFDIGLQLDHPNICRTIGMEDLPGYGPMIVMEHIDGDTLGDFINNHSLTAELANKIALQLASALDYMHSKQVIHRDLKPSNVMITHNGHDVKLIDFSLSDGDAFAILKQPAGTSGYIAPEQYLADAKATIESDIYSFGMVVKDMADATNDKELRRVAQACTRRNPADRPINRQQIFAHRPTSRRQIAAVIALVVIIFALIIHIFATLHQRSQMPASSVNVNSEGTSSDGNEALDYQLWSR